MKVKKPLSVTALLGAVFFFFTPTFLCEAETYHEREKLSAYTTYFNENDGGRCRNIELATKRIDGIALQPYGELSFNALVGKRTKENGYAEAKIIAGGQFVLGVGGGVCQVSTTLYNAALLAGLAVTEQHPHSLAVGYVPPSRDAMVSSESDLRLYNPFSETVYFSARVSSGALTVTVRGKKTVFTYEIESKTLAYLSPEPPEETADSSAVREGKDGLTSEAYLKTYQNGVLVTKKRLRKDTYAPVRGKIYILP